MKTKQPAWDPEKVSQLEKLFANEGNRSLADCHQIGRILADLKPGYGKAGKFWLNSLNTKVSNWPYKDWSIPNSLMKFVTVYPEFDPQLFANVKWGHMVELIVVKDASVREDLLMRLKDKEWTVRELQEEIQKRAGTPPERHPKRKKKVPTDPAALLREFRLTVQHLNQICTAWTSAKPPILHRLKPKRAVDHDSLPSEDELTTQINSLSKCAAKALDTLKGLEDGLFPPETKQLPDKGD